MTDQDKMSELIVEGEGEYVNISYPGFSPIAEEVPRKEAVMMVAAFNAELSRRAPVQPAQPVAEPTGPCQEKP